MVGNGPRLESEIDAIIRERLSELIDLGLIGGTGRYGEKYYLTMKGVEELEGEQ